MKTVSKLTGKATDAPPLAVTTVLNSVMEEPVTGFFLHHQLSPEGLTIRVAPDIGIIIPLDELRRFAQSIEPRLVPPSPAKMAKAKKA